MSNSPLVCYTKLSPNHSGKRKHAIDTVTIHCVVGHLSVETMGAMFAKASYGASCNYCIGDDGRIGLIVPEDCRSWCSSSSSNDNRAITIECASDTKSPYKVNDKVYASLIALLADIAKRNAIPRLLWKNDPYSVGHPERQNMTVHRWFANKACPGDYLMSKMGDIATEVNKRLEEKTMSELPKEAYGVKEQEPAPWAKEGWNWAQEVGLLDGTRPLDTVTRQELAVFGKRLYDLLIRK